MARQSQKSGQRGPRFFALRYDLLDHSDFLSLSDPAKALMVDICRQYNGFNNGDFCLTISMMKERGWNSNAKLRRAIRSLIDANLLVITRQGGRHQCSLYGFTWLAIDECKGKLDFKPGKTPLRKLSIDKFCAPSEGSV